MPVDQRNAEILAMFESEAMDKTQSYLSRGRGLESWSDDQLLAAWASHVNALADDTPTDERAYNDVSSEIDLRKLKIDTPEAKTALSRLVAKSKSHDEQNQGNPEYVARIEADIAARLTAVRPPLKKRN